MSPRRAVFNLDAAAWRRLRRNWSLPLTPALAAQSYVAGPVVSGLHRAQRPIYHRRLETVDLAASVFIVGYWRSGTTLAHELLSLDARYAAPTTYDCFNPHHFLLTRSRANAGSVVQRPMDEMTIGAASPQEDEFALLSLGARSPYEAFIAPADLARALRLADPRDLNVEDRGRWSRTFMEFLRAVSLANGERPLMVKSPTHGYRLATIRRLIPRAKFIVVTRRPLDAFESVVGMWGAMSRLYGLSAPLPDDAVREIILRDRPRYEALLREGLTGLDSNRHARIRYEDLASDPVRTIQLVYDRLELGDFDVVRESLVAQADARRGYRARSVRPSPNWAARIEAEWADLFERYGYDPG